jgi:hypothetical protein
MDAGMTFDGREFAPGEGVVLEDYMADQVAERMRGKYGCKVYESSARCWERPLRIEAVQPGDTLVAWRGCALGDQLVWVGLLAIIKRRCPGLTIVNYTAAPKLWAGVDGLPCEMRQDPIPFADWQAAQWHLTGEGLFEDAQHPDQPDLWTVQLRAAGIDPETVPASERRAVVPCTEGDLDKAFEQMHASGGRGAVAPADPPGMVAAADRLGDSPVAVAPVVGAAQQEHAAGRSSSSSPSSVSSSPTSRPQVLWQLAASTPVRSYPPQETREAIAGLLQAGCRVVVTGTKAQIAEYSPLPDGVTVLKGGVRVLFAAVAMADCVVCPDSVVGWVADAYGVAAVSLWGSFLPGDRLGADTSHRPLIGAVAGCSPCRKHEKPWLPPGCPEHGGGYCRVIQGIAPAEIVRQVKEMI